MVRDQVSAIVRCQFANAVQDKIAGQMMMKPGLGIILNHNDRFLLQHFEKILGFGIMEEAKIIDEINSLELGDFLGDTFQINRKIFVDRIKIPRDAAALERFNNRWAQIGRQQDPVNSMIQKKIADYGQASRSTIEKIHILINNGRRIPKPGRISIEFTTDKQNPVSSPYHGHEIL
jgi:hypothetical protein